MTACACLLGATIALAQSPELRTYRSPRAVFRYPAAWGEAVPVLVPECKLADPSDKPDGIAPSHATVYFRGGGPVTGKQTEPCHVPDFSRTQVRVFPVGGWKRTDPKTAETFAALDAVMKAGKLAPDATMPFVPFIDAFPAFTEHVHVADLQGGRGAGFLTQWMIEGDTIGARLVYVFQAVSADGKIYLLATFPVQAKVRLPEFPLIREEAYEAAEARYRPYAAQVTGIIHAAKPEDFTPSLADILAMCRSIDMR